MAEFQKVLKEKERICDKYMCATCPLGKFHKLGSEYCSRWIVANPKQAERIIMDWAAEHPLITNGMKFREVFGQLYEGLFEPSAIVRLWLEQEYKGGQDEQN